MVKHYLNFHRDILVKLDVTFVPRSRNSKLNFPNGFLSYRSTFLIIPSHISLFSFDNLSDSRATGQVKLRFRNVDFSIAGPLIITYDQELGTWLVWPSHSSKINLSDQSRFRSTANSAYFIQKIKRLNSKLWSHLQTWSHMNCECLEAHQNVNWNLQ